MIEKINSIYQPKTYVLTERNGVISSIEENELGINIVKVIEAKLTNSCYDNSNGKKVDIKV